MNKLSKSFHTFFPVTRIFTIGLALACLLVGAGNVYAQNGTDEGAINQSSTISIAIEHSVSESYVLPGAAVHFAVIVTNTGDIALENVKVLDPAVPDCARQIGKLVPEQVYTYSCELEEVNTTTASEVTVVGSAENFPLVVASAEVQIDVIGVALSIVKEPLQVDPHNGDRVTMTYRCANNGANAAIGVQLVETVPDDMYFVPEASAEGWTCENGAVDAGTTCAYSIDRIEAGDVATGMFPFVVAAAADATTGNNPSTQLFLPLING